MREGSINQEGCGEGLGGRSSRAMMGAGRADGAGYFCRSGSIKEEGRWVTLVFIRVRARSLD